MNRMKGIIYFIVAAIVAVFMIAASRSVKDDQNYCAKLKDGMIVVQKGETQITSDVILANGTRIQTDGVVIKKDGGKLILKDGDCVDKEGNLVDTAAREKNEKKNNQKQEP
jgi:hypothetical protein